MSQRFAYASDARFTVISRLFGFRPRHDCVTLTDTGTIRASFGFVTVETPRSNIEGAHVTSGYRWWTAIGVRRSMKDSGLSFGTTNRAGACIHFSDPVLSPLARRRGHEALTVTVEDPAALVAALSF